MLKNEDIIILGTAKFDGPYESTSFTIARHLAKDNRVYYVDYPFTWKDYFGLKNTEQFRVRKPHFAASADGIIDTDTPGLKVLITPPVASINFISEGKIYRVALLLNEKIIIRRIQKLIRKQGLKDVIYINSHTFHYPDIAKYIKPAMSIYHCVDPLIVPYDRKHGVTSEAQLVKDSDMVICTSKHLYEEKKLQNPETYFVANAADISHSSKALDPDLPVHKSLDGIPRPIIGYFGNIERRMDFPLLKAVIDVNKDKSFVFAGPVVKEYAPEWLFATENVYLPGRLPYEEMPAMIKGFDVAMIPFKKDEVSRSIFPLKLFEYLGAAKPVVAINFNPDLSDFTKDTVIYCDTAQAFSEAVTRLLKPDEEMKAKRIAVAAENTWEERAREFSELINNKLYSKRAND